MKISVKRDVFVSAFKRVVNFTERRELNSVFRGVLLVAEENCLSLMATDGDVGVREDIVDNACFRVVRCGSVLLPGTTLETFFADESNRKVKSLFLEVVDNRLVVKDGRFRYCFDDDCERVDRFLKIPRFRGKNYFKISVAEIERMIRRTRFATTLNNKYFELSGVEFFFERDKATAVATDGRRLAVQECAAQYCSDGSENEFQSKNVIFPLKPFRLIEQSRFLASEASFSFYARGEIAEACIQLGNVTVVSPLIRGITPDWTKIIPDTSNYYQIEFLAGDFERATRLSTRRSWRRLDLEDEPALISVKDGELSVDRLDSPDKTNVAFPVKYDGASFSTMINIRYLSEFLQTIPPNEIVKFYYSSSDFRVLFVTGDSYRYCVMAMKTSDE